MKPAPFDYIAPETLAEALEIKAQNGDEAKILAGGQSLIPSMNFRLIQPGLLVDLNGVEELSGFRNGKTGQLRIGSMTRQRALERNDLVREMTPLLYESVPYIAHPQIRNRGTIGGSLAHADPAAELPAIMVALDATFTLTSKEASRQVRACDFFQGIFTTELRSDEILTEISVPVAGARTGYGFVEFARRRGDYALLGVAASVTLDDDGRIAGARLVFLNAGEVPAEASNAAALLTAREASQELFEEAGRAAAGSEITVTGTIHASASYLEHLARVLTARALHLAHTRAVKSNDRG